ncbi:hypothetical protein T439DRAFT_359514 [Meredithblackwellia eburnea MCA 4105]
MGRQQLTAAKDREQQAEESRTERWWEEFKHLFKLKYAAYWVLIVVFIAASVVVSVYQNTIVAWIVPWKEWIASRWWTKIVSVLLLVLFAIPPMVGHVVLVVIYGMVYGLLQGCIITVVGTILGEYVVFVAVRALFMKKAIEKEKESVNYACTAELLRTGGLWINTLVRLSFLSGHVVTILQAVANVPSWIFLVGMLPAQLRQCATVYIGTVFVTSQDPNKAGPSNQALSFVIYALTFLLSVIAAYISMRRAREIYHKINTLDEARGDSEDLLDKGIIKRSKMGSDERRWRDGTMETDSDDSGYSGGY